MTHICVSNLTIIGSDNGLSPDQRQAIIWTNAGILLIGPLGTNFTEISIVILTYSFKKMRLNVSSAKWRPFCLGLNVLTYFHLGPNVRGQCHTLSCVLHIDGLVHERCNSSALAMELRLSCINPSTCPDSISARASATITMNQSIITPVSHDSYCVNYISHYKYQANSQREVERDLQPIGFFVIDGFIFSQLQCSMMMPWHWNTFCITYPLWGESALWLLVDSRHKRPVMHSFDRFFLLLPWTSCWTNSSLASDLRHHDAHVTE